VNQTDILIDTKYLKKYGEFHKEWKEKISPVEQILPNGNKIIIRYNIEYINEKTEKTLSISPIFILLCLIDSKIESQLLPVSWKTSKVNDDYLKIKFKNKNKILYINKSNKSIVDKIPRKIVPSNYSSNSNTNNHNNFINPLLTKEEKEEQEKILFLNELENQDKNLEEAKIRKQKELELEEKRKKEKKVLSKMLGNKHFLLKDFDDVNTKKKQKIGNESDSESEDNIAEGIDEGNVDKNFSNAELKIIYSNEIKLYKELLEENNVNILTKFQDLLPKLIYDSRYLKIPKKIRERIFDEYVREKELKEKELKVKEIEMQKEIENEIEIEQVNNNNNQIEEKNDYLDSEFSKFKDTEKYYKKKEIDVKGKKKEEDERLLRKISQDKLKAIIKSQIEKGEIHSNTPFSEFEARNIHNPDFYNALQIDREFLFNEAKLKVKKILEESKISFINLCLYIISA